MNQPMRNTSFHEEAAARVEADARKKGDAYLRYWAAWSKVDPNRPRLARSAVVYVGRYEDEKKITLRPEARGEWLDDLAEAVGYMVLALPPLEREAVFAVYLRLKFCDGGYEHAERIKERYDEDCARAIGVHRATMYRRLGRARQRVEDGAEQMNLIPAPDLDAA